MERRHFLITTAAGLVMTTSHAQSTAQIKVSDLSQALLWLDQLEHSATAHSTGEWPLDVTLGHMAQSIEMSMAGFPQPKSELFQNTVGAAAFAVFKWRRKMSHGLAEPIPGAPVLVHATTLQPAAARLRQAINDFHKFNGKLAPHFAYGVLSKSDFALAHTLHIANHQDEIVLG
jgi:hypothetical protein